MTKINNEKSLNEYFLDCTALLMRMNYSSKITREVAINLIDRFATFVIDGLYVTKIWRKYRDRGYMSSTLGSIRIRRTTNSTRTSQRFNSMLFYGEWCLSRYANRTADRLTRSRYFINFACYYKSTNRITVKMIYLIFLLFHGQSGCDWERSVSLLIYLFVRTFTQMFAS